MSKPTSFFRVFTESGPLVLVVATALLLGIAGPASAQFFNFGNFGGPPQSQPRSNGFGGGGWFGGDAVSTANTAATRSEASAAQADTGGFFQGAGS